MGIDYHLFSNIGSREVNEDSVRAASKDDAYCFILCDGLGGHSKGELASAFVADYVIQLFLQSQNLDAFMAEALVKAQGALLEEQKRYNAQLSMKTTATLLLIDGESYHYAYIGDSRIYTFRKNKLLERTLDHSVPQMLAIAGDIKEKQIRKHPDRNRLLRVMGVDWDGIRCEISDTCELKAGDAFLLCSDGFWELVEDKQMIKTLKHADTAETWITKMAEIIEKKSAKMEMDNFSAIAIKCTSE